MMKALLISACLSLITFPLLARADEASKLTKIEEMLVLTHADQVVQQVTAQMQPMMAQQMKQLNLPEDARPAVEEMQKKMMDWVSTKGSPQEFVGRRILRGLPGFLKSDVFGVGHGHALRFQ